jgi:hypothetical protein
VTTVMGPHILKQSAHLKYILNALLNSTHSDFFDLLTSWRCWPLNSPRALRRRSTTARLLRSWVQIPPKAWMSVCCECCVLSGRGLCDNPTTRPEESYRLWRVVVCDLEISSMRSQTSIVTELKIGDISLTVNTISECPRTDRNMYWKE